MKGREQMRNFLNAGLYALTDEALSRGRGNIEVVAAMLEAGVKVLQYREKEKKARSMYEECVQIRRMTAAAGATFIVNDHIDLALAVGADGVHIGQQDLPPEAVRRLIGDDMILGLSTHAPEQAEAAARRGVVDYIGAGPVFATKTKKDVVKAVGLEYVSYVARHIDLPFVAIGGIKESNLPEVRAHGAKIVAIVSDIVGAPDIKAKIRALQRLG